ncbi:hypothetical protein VTK56DRAFT_9953 [Thermocarpiscus australiensis]
MKARSILPETHRTRTALSRAFAAIGACRMKPNILKRYQSRTPFLRPLIDEIQEPADPPSIVLKHMDSELLTESKKKRLTHPEIKQVARCILEALRVLHEDGVVRTDIKMDNIFVNYGQGDQRFSDIRLGDCGGAVSQDSKFAKEGHIIGAAFTRSPEAMFQLPWGTATDVWSFGNAPRAWWRLPPLRSRLGRPQAR